MSINTEPYYMTYINIKKAEDRYGATYVMETPLRYGDSWRDEPSLIFYNTVAHPQGSNYFAISRDGEDIVISDGIKAVTGTFTGVRADNDDIVYSHYRHHMVHSSDKSVWIDGGRDYFRSNSSDRVVYFEVVDGELQIVENPIGTDD